MTERDLIKHVGCGSVDEFGLCEKCAEIRIRLAEVPPERTILAKLIDRFRWAYYHYDQYVCPSCGALSSVNTETNRRHRIDQCSPSCIWRKAEEILNAEPSR